MRGADLFHLRQRAREFHEGAVRVPSPPGLGVQIDCEALARLHEQYLACGIRNRDDRRQMQKYEPSFTGVCPRF